MSKDLSRRVTVEMFPENVTGKDRIADRRNNAAGANDRYPGGW